jgi:hypothetical protein
MCHSVTRGWTVADVLLLHAARLAQVQDANARMGQPSGHTSVGICVEGGALHHCLLEHCHEPFLALCNACRSVVCCRVSPMQKAQVGCSRAPGWAGLEQVAGRLQPWHARCLPCCCSPGSSLRHQLRVNDQG